jgi:hypothetical protein
MLNENVKIKTRTEGQEVLRMGTTKSDASEE